MLTPQEATAQAEPTDNASVTLTDPGQVKIEYLRALRRGLTPGEALRLVALEAGIRGEHDWTQGAPEHAPWKQLRDLLFLRVTADRWRN